jgi:hypothetical protein
MRLALVLLVLSAVFASVVHAEQRRYNQPRVNGIPVDRCSPWGENCGQGGADAFCQEQGFDRASAWNLYRPGRTWVIGSNQVCQGGDCQALSYVDCARNSPTYPGSASGGETFTFPRANGLPVDRCATWGENCGQGGADQFCATKGFARAGHYETYRPGRSYVIGSRRVCEGNDCEALRRVRCVGDSGSNSPPIGSIPALPPILRPPSNSVQRFERPRVNGASVDVCSTWANDCGRGGADLFCARQGYRNAVSWQSMPANRSFVIGSNRYCNESCTVLRFVDCAR